jgi:hypothetical protein
VLWKPGQCRLIRFFIALFPDRPDISRCFLDIPGKFVVAGAFSNNSIHDDWPIVMDNHARFLSLGFCRLAVQYFCAGCGAGENL